MLLDFTYERSGNLNSRTGVQQSVNENWEKEIFDFLEDWFSSCNSFEIKTSGTTGPPKKVSFSRESLIASAKITINTFGLKQGDTLLMCLPVHFVAGKLMLIRAIVGSMKLIALKPSANPVSGLIDPIAFAAFTPHQLQNILNNNPDKLKLIEKAIIGGSPVNKMLEKELVGFKTAFFETFGMSETLTHVAIRPLNGVEKSDHFRILKGFSITSNTNDRLIIRADHLKNPPLLTNDIVKMIDSETFKWLGRSDDVINSGGVKLFPAIIEQKLSCVIDREFIITKHADKDLGECVVLIIEGKPFDKADLKSLQIEMGKLLDKFEIPRQIKFIPGFNRNKNGKIIWKIVE